MKTMNFEDGSELKISETPEEAEKLRLEFPTPFLAKKTHDLAAELRALDPDLTVELLLKPTGDAILFSRDMSLFPPRMQNWLLQRSKMGYDNWAHDYALFLMNYWTRARERRNVKG